MRKKVQFLLNLTWEGIGITLFVLDVNAVYYHNRSSDLDGLQPLRCKKLEGIKYNGGRIQKAFISWKRPMTNEGNCICWTVIHYKTVGNEQLLKQLSTLMARTQF